MDTGEDDTSRVAIKLLVYYQGVLVFAHEQGDFVAAAELNFFVLFSLFYLLGHLLLRISLCLLSTPKLSSISRGNR